MTRKASLLFAILLVFQSITSGLGIAGITSAEGEQPNVFKDVSILDENEQSIENKEVEDGDNVWVHIDWSTENVEVDIGDFYQITLPESVAIQEEQAGQLEADNDDIGVFHISANGDVVVEFNEKIADHPAAEGTFVIKGLYADQDSDSDENEEVGDDHKEKNDEDVNDDSDATESQDNTGEEVDDSEDTNENESNDNDEDVASEDKTTEDDGASENEPTTVQADEDGEKHGFKLELDKITDIDGEAFDDQHPMDPHEEFKLKLDWYLEDGHNYVAGDTEIFDLPKGIKIQKNIEIELQDEHGQIIANAVVTPDKKVELTFTDFVEGHSAVSGWMEMISTLDIEEVEEEDGEIIIDPIGEEGELRIPIEKSNKDKTIEKKGEPNKGYNADEIDWEVIINKNKTSLENAKVMDDLPNGTEYKDGSLKVTKLKVDLDGNILGDGEEVAIDPEFGDDGQLIVPLGDTNDAYRVEYVTNVTDDEKREFKNDASLIDDELDDVHADSTITINRGDPIKKSAVKDYNPKTGIIEWEIEFNFNQKDLSDVTLKDAWTPEGMLELVEDSLKFQEVTIDDNGNAHHEGDAVDLPNGAELTVIDDGFEVTGISTDKAYKVMYQTKVKDRVLDPLDVANTAGFGSESDGSGTHVGQYYGAKSAGTVDYAEKTIEWTIAINHDEWPMENISVEDTLGDGLTLLEDTISISVDGKTYEGDYTVSGDNPFTIDFPEEFSTDKKIYIVYKTEFDADNVPDNKPTNKAAITWTPEGEDDSITKEVEAGTELNKETEDYSWKNGSYNPETKEILWEMIVNYRENDFSDLIIQDKPQGNQQIIDGSAEVKELYIAADGSYADGDTVEDAATIDEAANTLDVKLGETNKAYKITYKTSLEGLDDMQDEYVNQAEVLDGDESISEIDAKVGVVKDRKYGDKSGFQDGKQVHWSIDVNLVQQKIKDLKLVDTISDNQEYLEDTINVYHATIDENGKASKGEEVPSDEYELVVDKDAGEFTVDWKSEVERAFIVEYSTLFFEKHNGEVRNDYTITGDSIEEDSSADDGYNVTIEQLGSGGGEGTAGYLVIDKVDATDGQDASKLEGAEFDLIDADTGNVLKSGTTDENGQIDFGRLLFGDYTLKETKVPEGYVTPEEEQTITIDEAYKPGDDIESFAYTVENYVPVFAIELSKTDDEGNVLEGVEFTLFDAQDNEVTTETTDEDGKIIFEDLEEAGTYYVQETKAPAGYVLDETKYDVQVGEKEKEPVTVSAENKARGAVNLTKTDQDTGKALKGVEFELQKENDAGEFETVKTYTTDENGQITTSNTLEAGNYRFVEVEGLDGYRTNDDPITFTVDVNSTEDQQYTMTNEQYKGAVKLVKKDAATGVTLEGAEFELVDAKGELVEENLVTNHDGEIEIDDLFLGDYQLIETKAPTGYELNETPIDIEITEDNQVIEKTMTNNKITDITVEKKWNHDGGNTEPVTIKLLPTDETVELNEENDWKATFKDLDVYDESGEPIDYQVEEVDVDGYNSSVTGDVSEGFVVTNTETTSVTGTKTWLDDDSDQRPDKITMKLLANGAKVDVIDVTADTDWEYTFADLDKFDDEGEIITYTVEEIEIDGYETTIDGFDITNTRTGTIDVSGEKVWKDVDAIDQRPKSITVNLTREVDGVLDEDFSESKTVEADSRGKWLYSFTELEEFNEQGEAFTYLIEEEDVSDKYESKVDGYDITNTRVDKTEISGTKKWKDDNVDDRPDAIDVDLLQNDKVIDTIEVTAEDDWAYAFTDLDAYDDEGRKYDYTIKEQPVPGYVSEVDGTDVTNTRSEKTSIEVVKTWLDDNSEEERPDTITVYLKQNGDKVDEVELSADNDWGYEFTDLEAYDQDGMPYEYTIEEKAVDGYDTTINGFDITNLRVGKTEVVGEKIWLDDNAADRPESITVHLLANGEKTDKKIEVDDDSNWEYAFTDLEQYDDQGVEIEYTVEEDKIDGYDTTIDGYDITNVRIGKTEVTGNKMWDEVDDRYRADSITVTLLANGEAIDTIKVSADTDWSYGFTGLDKYDDQGKQIAYTVEESDVPKGYTSKVDGYDLTNTQESTEVEVEKNWNEVDKRYRPDTVTVQLLANGEEEATVKMTKEMDWTHTFTDLAKYDKDGTLIEYTVKEVDVPKGYESDVEGYTITNTQTSTEVKGEKTWEEVDSQYRPASITIHLLADGERVDAIDVTEEDDWEYTFTDLAKYNGEGEEINYTVEEEEVPGYTSEVDGYNVTNTQITTDISGEKTWVDDEPESRPSSIVVELVRNGEKIDEQNVTSDTDWTYAFTDLPAYDEQGVEYVYTIAEQPVKGYETTVDGYDITNTFVAEKEAGSESSEDPDVTDDERENDPETESDSIDTETNDDHTLPKTYTNIYHFLLAGFVFIVLATGLYILSRRQRNN